MQQSTTIGGGQTEALLLCPVCAEIFTNACETACGHSFCEYCINRCMEQSTLCPVCRGCVTPVHPSWTLRSLVSHHLAQQRQTSPGAHVKPPPSSASGRPISGQHLDTEELKKRGNDCYKNSEYAMAIEYYTLASESAPMDPFPLANRALCYMKLGQHARALVDCNRVLELHPHHMILVKTCMRKAVCHEVQHQYKEAWKAIDLARSLPEYSHVKEDIEEIAHRLPAKRDNGGERNSMHSTYSDGSEESSQSDSDSESESAESEDSNTTTPTFLHHSIHNNCHQHYHHSEYSPVHHTIIHQTETHHNTSRDGHTTTTTTRTTSGRTTTTTTVVLNL
ncbi:hypothetical protein Pelo_2175 [Pelomyxa schiedti]|nr:hypothetical protein Pelo_2175 [Pelomyxa schiedti]